MELYNEKIDEFVDWVSGINSWTGEDITKGLSVAGGRIRELLQERLKSPFVLKEDTENNLYRMFSSETAYQMWLENPSDNAGLELFNFVRPSDYKLNIVINSSNRYVRDGDKNNDGTRILFSWDIRNDEGESPEGLTATFTISNETTGKVNTFTRWYNKGENADFSIYEYLQPGTNTVTILGRGSDSGARNSVTFNITLLQINVTSSFDFAAKYNSGTQILLPCIFLRNNQDGTAKVHFVIDRGGDGKEWEVDVLKNTGTKININQRVVLNADAGMHTLQIWAETQYNDGTITINSNLLYYTFIIATSDISVNKYICIGTNFDSGVFPFSSLVLTAVQYLPTSLQWGYYTDAELTDTQILVQWRLYRNEVDQNPQILSTMTANTKEQSDNLSYVPTIYSEYEDGKPLTFISAYWNQKELIRIPVQIVQNGDINVYETGAYSLKLSAYGKTNDSSDRSQWVDEQHNITTTFNNISWDPNSGWYNNSFRTVGQDEYAQINYHPFNGFSFSSGKTIEIEFETEKVNSDDDKLIVIGNQNKARIEITPVKATLYGNAGEHIVHTNYKSHERIKLAFIINPIPDAIEDRDVESGLVYIINNGVLERSANAGRSEFDTQGYIKIGGSKSGIRVYNMRVYNYAITYTDAYNNYVYDSEDKINIVNNNNILDSSGQISFDLCKNKLDTILISGDLTNILSGQTDKENSTTDVTIERICPYDSSKNFKINNVQIRKHGLSTLNYPITSMKFWLNKSKSGVLPTYEIAPQDKIQYNKNRYRMKEGAIPSNKFVLQANYADSSGVHNGGFERLIQNSWFNAKIDGEYKLRTIPQLFATNETVTHTDANLHDVSDVIDGLNEYGKNWNYYSPNSEFPYQIRVSPDSFPCVVFYYDEAGTQQRTFLGQYVFMDDKKSDFLYGERSIYRIPSDPFCLTAMHAKDDTDENIVWDNDKVLRLEVLESNNQYSSYMTADGFTSRIGDKYAWESSFEVVYPDEMEQDDEKAGKSKFDPDSKFAKKTKPFVDWYMWLVSTRNNQEKFQNEAAQHIDLYKMAAYYIFLLRFGLVDSMERNAQIKTYDGIHFHYEPWDMDIALGNKNDGGIAYDPPIDRNTKLPGSISTYAFSGRSANEQTGEIVTSNWLFDALEAWPYWMNTIVPKVANALFNAGLTYENVTLMFDNNYANAWCETIYNKSGFFKYVESGNGDPQWLNWLLGSRMTHRHWWLSTSMDYYDAMWFCGDYKNHYIYITANVSTGSGAHITITPSKTTYMTVSVNYQDTDITEQTTRQVSRDNPLVWDVPNLNTKVPVLIYGANFMEEVDLGEIATGLDAVDLNGVYSSVLGSPLKVLNIGTRLTQEGSNYITTLASLGGAIRAGSDVLLNLQTLNIRGQRNFTDLNNLMKNYNLSEVQNIYAMGSGLTNFFSSESGNKFNVIELPDTVSIFEINNSTWNDLSFWTASTNQQTNVTTLSRYEAVTQSGITNIPAAIQTLRLKGTSCQNYNSIQLVRNWLRAIVASGNNLSDYTFEADKIYWTSESVGGDNNLLTYEELSIIAQLNGEPDPDTGKKTHPLKGYIVLRNEDNTQLTPQQLTQIKNWFGDTVFTKNSSGLVIDHKLDYVQINVGGDVEIHDGEIYLKEGGRASLNATKFSLSEDSSTEYTWAVGPDDGSTPGTGWPERGLTIIFPEDSADHIAYLQSSESQAGGNYDIRIYCSAEGNNYSTVVHMVGVTYPTDMKIGIEAKSSTLPKTAPGITSLWLNGISVDAYVTSLQSYTATVKNITYTISGNGNSCIYNTSTGIDTFSNWGDLYLTVARGKNGVLLGCPGGIPSDDTIYEYTVSAAITFNSNRKIEILHKVLIIDDSRVIVSSIQTELYTAINNRWIQKYGEPIGKNNIYRTDLLNLDGTITFDSVNNLITSGTRQTVLKYMPSIQQIIILNSPNLHSTYSEISDTNKNQMRFEYILQLQSVRLINCPALTDDIDLQNNQYITDVYFSGTNVNVLLTNNSNITNLVLDAPTSISLLHPAVLTANGININDSSRLNNIRIEYMNTNLGFNTFAKIMNLL